jgi:hypothetical protein
MGYSPSASLQPSGLKASLGREMVSTLSGQNKNREWNAVKA